MKELKTKFDNLLALQTTINEVTTSISKGKIVFFNKISVNVSFNNNELVFNNLVSWLYVMYFEFSRKNIDFISKKITPYNIFISENALNSKRIIHAFRTILQHQMDYENSESDKTKKNLCETWCFSLIQKKEPTNPNEWLKCSYSIVESAYEFLLCLYNCLISISQNEHVDIVFNEWIQLFSRNFSKNEFEIILKKVLNNIGLLSFFDSHIITIKYFDIWRKDLEVLHDGFDFEIHAYKIIERTILKKEILPIDGNDIISLGVKPGRRVFELLIKGREIFYDCPCNKNELLDKLKKYI